MAEHQLPTYSNKPISEKQKAKEYQEHTQTYARFLTGAKWSTLVTVAILVVLYFVFIH